MNIKSNKIVSAVKCEDMRLVLKGSDLTLDHMMQARKRIKPFIHETPVLTSDYLNKLLFRYADDRTATTACGAGYPKNDPPQHPEKMWIWKSPG